MPVNCRELPALCNCIEAKSHRKHRVAPMSIHQTEYLAELAISAALSMLLVGRRAGSWGPREKHAGLFGSDLRPLNQQRKRLKLIGFQWFSHGTVRNLQAEDSFP